MSLKKIFFLVRGLHTQNFEIALIFCKRVFFFKKPLHETLIICYTYLKFTLGQWGVEDAAIVVRTTGGELQEEVGGVIEELPLRATGVQDSQQLRQTTKSVGRQSALLVPKAVHLQPATMGSNTV